MNKNTMADFSLDTLVYVYNCAGEFVLENTSPLHDLEKAKELLNISETLSGFEYSVVMRFGVMGIIAEQKFSDEYNRDKVIDIMGPLYSQFNGSHGVSVGLLESENELWPQIFIPADVVFNNPNLLNLIIEKYDSAMQNIEVIY